MHADISLRLCSQLAALATTPLHLVVQHFSLEQKHQVVSRVVEGKLVKTELLSFLNKSLQCITVSFLAC